MSRCPSWLIRFDGTRPLTRFVGDRADERVPEIRKRTRVAEIAVPHRLRRYPGLEDPGIQLLTIELVPSKEEDLVAVLIEVRARDEEGSTDVESWVGELVLRLVLGSGQGAGLVEEPLIGVEPVIAQVYIADSVEVASARLADSVDGDRALRVLGGVVRLEDLEFPDHVGVRVD